MSDPPKQKASRPSPNGGKKLRGHPRDSPDVRLSKTLSWILRHGAKSEGLYMRPDGYVRVNDLVCLHF
jgi:2'-phosphotransferase